MPLHVIMSVTSDLVTDQRVQRSASALKEAGYQVMVVGRRLPQSLSMPGKRYRTKRFRLWFNKGPLFYANYNLRLLGYLLWHRADILYSHDLDTLSANFIASRLKRIPLVYDSHEYFTGVPELLNRPRVQRIWKRIEKTILPHLKYAVTVNESIARLYEAEYQKPFTVIRNVPETKHLPALSPIQLRRELGLPTEKRIILLQGAGINIQRGAEEAVLAMRHMENALLLIIGGGDVLPILKEMVAEHSLSDKVRFEGKKQPADLLFYSRCADIGLSLDKDTNINYRFSLPNKLFDYIHAGIPVLASDLPEVRSIVEGHGVGLICPGHDPQVLAAYMERLLTEGPERSRWIENTKAAAKELNWETERNKLLAIFRKIGY